MNTSSITFEATTTWIVSLSNLSPSDNRTHLILPVRVDNNPLCLQATVVCLFLFLHLDRLNNIPIAKHREKCKWNRNTPQCKSQCHLVQVGPVSCADRVSNRAANGLPRSQDAGCSGDIAISLRSLDLGHQPIDVCLQRLIEEPEEDVDGESRVEEGTIAQIESGWFGHVGESRLDDGVPYPRSCDKEEDEDIHNFRSGSSRQKFQI